MPGGVPTATISEGFGPWLRGTRVGVPMTIQQLADAAGLHYATVAELELGRQRTKPQNIAVFNRIAEALGLDLGYVLHKAGFNLGAEGVNVVRLQRVEAVVEVFSEHESVMRRAMAGALVLLGDEAPAELAADVGRALAALDLVTERLRREGFIASGGTEREATISQPRAWSESDMDFLRTNPDLSHEEAARHLRRTTDAIRRVRGRLHEGVAA